MSKRARREKRKRRLLHTKLLKAQGRAKAERKRIVDTHAPAWQLAPHIRGGPFTAIKADLRSKHHTWGFGDVQTEPAREITVEET